MTDSHRYRSVVRGVLQTAYETYTATTADDRQRLLDTTADFTTQVDRRLAQRIEEFFAAESPSFRVLSEEREVAPTTGSDPVAIVDEVDGTANLARGNGDLPFGTVVALTDSPDPTFDDVVAMGYLVLPTGDLYEAYRGNGAFLTRGWRPRSDERNERSTLSTSGREDLNGTPPGVLIDQYMLSGRPDLAETLWPMGYPGDFRSLCHHLVLVSRGAYDIAVSGDYCTLHEGKRATAEELAGAYRLTVESGGAVFDWDGTPIGSTPIGFAAGDTHDIVAAATDELALTVTRRL